MISAMTEVLLEDKGEITHDFVSLTYTPTSEVKETDFELFGDGSAQVIEGKPFSLHTNHTEVCIMPYLHCCMTLIPILRIPGHSSDCFLWISRQNVDF